MNFCKDCRFCVPSTVFGNALDNLRHAKCQRTSRPSADDPVTGTVGPEQMEYCATERAVDYDGYCRPSGVYFVAKLEQAA